MRTIVGPSSLLLALFQLLYITSSYLACGRTLLQQDDVDVTDPLARVPLEVVATTPAALRSGQNITIKGGQAIQVVFSRPVIAIGEDFGKDVQDASAPFSLQRNSDDSSTKPLATMRWPTTYIFRADPVDGEWPTDLQVLLKWSKGISTWDGVPLASTPPDATISTAPLTMSLASVQSDAASNATDGEWRTRWRKDVSEVPDDGILKFRFKGSKVAPDTLGKATFSLSDTGAPATGVTAASVPCPAPAYPVYPYSAAASFGPPPRPVSDDEICATVAGMKPNTRYTLTLPAGTAYNSLAGPIRKPLSVRFSSLLPFTSPLNRDPYDNVATTYSDASWAGANSRRLELLMPHGLDNGTTGADVASRVRIVDYGPAFPGATGGGSKPAPVALEVTGDLPAAAFAHVTAPLKPAHKYSLAIRPAEGSGPRAAAVYSAEELGEQPLTTLVEGTPDRIDFTTQRLPSRMSVPLDRGISSFQSPPAAWKYPVLTQGDEASQKEFPKSLIGAPVLSTGGLAVTLNLVLKHLFGANSNDDGNEASIRGKNGAQAIDMLPELNNAGSTGELFSVNGLDLTALLQPTGLAHIQVEEKSSYGTGIYTVNSALVSSSSVALGFVFGSGTFVGWATDNASGKPVAGVQIIVHGYDYEAGIISSQPVVTDAEGKAVINVEESEDDTYEYYGGSHVEYIATARTPDGRLMVVDLRNQHTSSGGSSKLASEVFVDRTVVGPGHKLHVSGYVRSQGAAGLSIPSVQGRILLCRSPDSCTGPASHVVTIDKTYGSFNHTILFNQQLIDLLGYNPVSLNFETCASVSACMEDQWQPSEPVMITVADPRPPTAELEFSSPSWAPPNSTVELNGTTVSLLGAEVVGAEVTITWESQPPVVPFFGGRESGGAERPSSSGSMNVTADADGKFSASIDLQSFDPPPLPGDSVTFDAVWIGPTRERLTASATTSVQYSEYVVSVATSVSDQKLVAMRDFSIVTTVSPDTVPASATIDVYAVAVTKALCAELDSCDSSRFSEPPAVRPDFRDSIYGTFYGGQVSTELSPEDQATLLGGDAEAVCSAVPPTGAWDACRWVLPSTGIYALAACLSTGAGGAGEACSVYYAGRLQQEWERQPLSGPVEATWAWKLPTGADGFGLGAPSEIYLDMPVNASIALLVWASASKQGTKLVPALKQGLNTASFAVDASCASGCTLSVLVSWPAQAVSPVPPSLPVHPRLDTKAAVLLRALDVGGSSIPVAAEQAVLQTEIAIKPGAPVAAAAEADEVVVEPLTALTIDLGVSQCAAGAAACSGGVLQNDVQVMVFAVDKAWLLLQSYELPDAESLFAADFTPALGAGSSADDPIHPAALGLWQQRNAALLRADPWLQLQSLSELNTPADKWLQTNFWPLHAGSYYVGYEEYYDSDEYAGSPDVALAGSAGGVAAAPAAAPPASPAGTRSFTVAEDSSAPTADGAAEGPAGGAGAAGRAPRVTSPLDTTPFFRTVVVPAGTNLSAAQVAVTAPATLSTYVVRTLAASMDGQLFGSSEAEFTVRRALSLTPSVPRLLRAGDAGTVGVVVTYSGAASPDAPAVVKVSLQVLSDAVTLDGEASQEVTFTGAESQQEARFEVTAEAVGEAKLLFSATTTAASDSLEVGLASLVTQAPVVVASSFAVSAGKGWQEGLQIPPAVPGTGELSVQAGVGNLPSQVAMATRLLEGTPEMRYVTANWPLAIMASHAALSQYGAPALQTPITLPKYSAERLQLGQNTTLCAALGAAVPYAARALDQLSSIKRLGLMQHPPRAWPGWTEPRRPDVYLNLMGRLLLTWSSTYGSYPANRVCGNIGTARTTSQKSRDWLSVGINQLFQDAVRARQGAKPRPYPNTGNLALLWAVKGPGFKVREALSASGAATGPAQLDAVAKDLSLERLVSEIPSLPIYEQGLLALTLAQHTAPPAGGAGLQQNLTDLFRITARTAYIAAVIDEKGPADSKAQASVMLSNLEVGNSSYAAIVQKHANYLASKMGADSVYYLSDVTTAHTMLALSAYDKASGSAKPNLSLSVNSAPLQILSAQFGPATPPAVQRSVSFDQLAMPPAPLTFIANGTGEASIAAQLTFVPAELPTSPAFRGLQVSMVIRLVDVATREPFGLPLSYVPLGATVHVLAQVFSPDTVGQATVLVLMAGGLEPIDGNLDDDGAINTCRLPWYLQSYSGFFSPSPVPWFPSCARVETTPANVTFHLAGMSAGTHDFTFLAVAASPGTYTMPPAIAFVNEQPEVMGLTAAQNVTVCAGKQCSAEEKAAASGPGETMRKACLNNCSGAGLCQTSTGSCICDLGFSGVDCSTYVS